MPSAPLVIGVDVKGDEELAASFRAKGSAFRRCVQAHVKALGEEARALAQSLVPVRSGKSRASIYSRVSQNAAGSVTLTVKPGKAGWKLAFSEFPQKSATVQVSAYQRHVARFTRRSAARTFHGRTGVVSVSSYRRANVLHFHPALTPARDYIAANAEQVMRDAVTEALEAE